MVAWVVPAAIAAGTIASSVLNNKAANEQIENENQRIDDAIRQLRFNEDDYRTNYDMYQNPLDYNTYTLGETEYNNVSIDPSVLSAQNQALEELINLSEAKGLNAIDQQALQEIVNAENRNLQGQNQAIAQDAMQRGVYGSGLEMAQRLQAAQSAANRMNNQDMDIMSQAQQRALEALSAYGNLAGNMRSQDFSEQARRADAIDAINKANWQNMQSNSNANIDNQNKVSQMNTDVQHKQQDSNVQAARDIWGNKTDVAALKTGQYNSNKEDARKRAESNNQLIGTLATSLGSALSGSNSK